MSKAPTRAPQPSVPQPSSDSPLKVNFTARYKQRSRTEIDDLEEFWKLPQEDFENCDMIQWLVGRQEQFGGLSRFSRNIFTIPGELGFIFCSNILNLSFKGSAVAVE
jgi:hypothetical protein